MRFRLYQAFATFVCLSILSAPACADDRARVEFQQPQPGVTIELRAGATKLANSAVPLLHEKVPAAADVAPDASIQPNKPHDWAVISNERNNQFDITLTALADEADRVILTAWNHRNEPIAQRTFDAPLDNHRIRFTVTGRGVWLLTLDGYKDDKPVYRLPRSFAVVTSAKAAQQSWNKDEYFVGICAFPGRYHWSPGGQSAKPAQLTEQQARDREAALMQHLGFQIARLDVSMVMPQNPKQPIDWQRMDASVKAYTSRGFQLDLQLMNPPDWAIDPRYSHITENEWRYPHAEQPYRRYVRELVKRYGGSARFVQVFNEPDQVEFWAGKPSEFVETYEQAREEIRKVLPDTPIANGGYAFIDVKKTQYFAAQLKGKVDWIAYHSHGDLDELKHDFRLAKKFHADAGYENPTFINTETGYAAWRLDQERQQAATAVHKLVHCWATGQRGILLFASRMTRGPGRVGRDFGFLDHELCPRFVYGAVAAFMRTYAGARFDKTNLETRSLHVYQFSRDDDKLLACFATELPRALTITSDATSATLIDEMGNAMKLKSPQRIELRADLFAQTLVLKGATTVRVEE